MPNPNPTTRYLIRKRVAGFMYRGGFRFYPISKIQPEQPYGRRKRYYKMYITIEGTKARVEITL